MHLERAEALAALPDHDPVVEPPAARGDDRRAGEVAFAAEAHAVLPVAVEGRDGALAALERDDTDELRRVVKALWQLLPEDSEARKKGFDSGVR